MLNNRQNIEKALAAFKNGEMIVVVDDNSRENEGDLVIAAQFCTTEHMAFLIRYSSGIICTPMSAKRAQQLALPPMVEDNSSAYHTAFTISVDAKQGTTTGISAYERALTARNLADSDQKPEDFVRPGHVFPLIAREAGVLQRSGHTEAAVDLCDLCGLEPVAVIGELMADDGTVLHGEAVEQFASKHNFPLISVEDLILYRQSIEKIIELKEKNQQIIGDYEATIYIYENAENIYEISKFLFKENGPTAIYINDRFISAELLNKLAKKYSSCICINYKLAKAENLLEQHEQAIARNIFWLKYGAIRQILKDFSFCETELISEHTKQEHDLYKEILAENGR